MVKTCRKCGVAKPLDGFRTVTASKPGRKSWTGPSAKCRECERAIGKRQLTEPAECSKCHVVQPPEAFCAGQLVCHACAAIRARGRSQEYRRAEREREAARLGKPLPRTREEIARAATLTRASKAPALTQLRLTLRRLLRLLFEQRCTEVGMRAVAVAYRVRYRTDAAFREREIARTWRRKEASGVLRTDGRTSRAVASDGTLTATVIQRLFAEATDCPYCGQWMHSRARTLDHIDPVSRGGAHSITNVVVCCRTCNTRKLTRTPEQMGWPRPATPALAMP